MKFSWKALISTTAVALIQFLPLIGNVSSAQAAKKTYTYTACYFQKGDKVSTETWQWGLEPDDSWYTMSGNWAKRRHIGTTYFNTSDRGAVASCQRSQAYYQLSGYRLVGVYARDKTAGSNYEIRVNGQELFRNP